MSETEERRIEEVTIDLSTVPLRPTSKREVQQLETALIIGTIYRPEVLELIRDPLERATWVDSLAVAAAALAREKAGYTIPQIAEELGRSETSIRAHLHGKTKAGKLVRETYELLARNQLRLVVPFVAGAQPIRPEELQELLKARDRLRELEEKVGALEEENRRLREQLERCVKPEELEAKLSELRGMIDELEKENEKLREQVKQLEAYRNTLEKVKEVLGCK
jgi:probable regulatory domain-containing protein